MIHDQKGMLSISCLIILCILSMLMYYLYSLYGQEMQIVNILQKSMMARNFTVSEASKLITVYKQDKNLWIQNCNEAMNKYDLAEGILVDTKQINSKQFEAVLINAYLVHYQGDVYILVVESTVKDITNQVCIYLTKKDDEIIVERWER